MDFPRADAAAIEVEGLDVVVEDHLAVVVQGEELEAEPRSLS